MSEIQLEQCYKLLGLEPGASVQEIDAAYSKTMFEKLRQGAKHEKQPLKLAYETLRNYTLMQACETAQDDPTSALPRSIAEHLNQQFGAQQVHVQIKLHQDELQVLLKAKQPPSVEFAKVVYRSLSTLELPNIKLVNIYGMRGNQSIAWKQQFQLFETYSPTDSDPYSFENRNINTLAFPVALIFAWITNVTPLKILFRSTHIWIHEVGHATVAWLAGRKATPLPFGWTNIEEARSLFVYGGILVLLGLLFWAGKREGKPWLMGLAIGFAALQFYMTWLMPTDAYEMWLSFGGIGGEFYLSTLLMAGFYVPLPDRWRWDFWRYFVVLGAANTLWSSFLQWHQIKIGNDTIPWGTLFGGGGDAGGDMNQLSLVYGWSDQQIINTYSQLGNTCLIILIGIYGIMLIKGDPAFLIKLRQRFR
ncbi:M50 family metallopeptidase [Myxacorys almedinensis]|uniref:Uncharacterized protein n=1 Tax=Myxacorys almedinensis A TaxID=2690445 RepID=A0A8J8CL35_9CYAN|nr:M50 family metallopeptidase [Myxacorys almedinensis]NDJ17315.1 hypothetical protein [Myxacorys almedinensis A]